jgi:hypothetical protein
MNEILGTVVCPRLKSHNVVETELAYTTLPDLSRMTDDDQICSYQCDHMQSINPSLTPDYKLIITP